MVHLDPNFAKHRAGREVMQKLEDTFKEPGGEGPGVEIGQRLPLWPLKTATWVRNIYKTGEASQSCSQTPPEQQAVTYILVYLPVSPFYFSLPLE